MRAAVLFLVAAGLAGCHPVADRTGAAFGATGELVALSGGGGGAANACFTCHGLAGQGDGASVPRLAGLDGGYLQKQMEDYASGLRADEVMGAIARRLAPDERRAVAAWYAGRPVPLVLAGPMKTAPAAYAACIDCHGAAGEGRGAANPALAGQPAAYTLQQLRRWKTAERRNDPRGVMTAAVAPLSEAEMKAIAAWLETQPASPPPGNAAASASGAASAGAGSAAFRAGRHPDRPTGA
jgi:cytochrome c553